MIFVMFEEYDGVSACHAELGASSHAVNHDMLWSFIGVSRLFGGKYAMWPDVALFNGRFSRNSLMNYTEGCISSKGKPRNMHKVLWVKVISTSYERVIIHIVRSLGISHSNRLQ